MTTSTKQLSISLSRPEGGDLVQLARQCSVTRQALALQAVRQLLTIAQGGDIPPTLQLGHVADPRDGVGVTVTLTGSDALDLASLAQRMDTSQEVLGRGAVLHLLATAKAGAVPMVRVMEPPPLEEVELASDGAARLNFSKAKLIIDRLHHISEFGFDDAGRAALTDLESLKTIPPF